MAEAVSPDFRRVDQSPECSGQTRGVQIKTRETLSSQEDILLYGSFQISKEDKEEIAEHLHRALVLVVMNKAFYAVSNPFQDSVFFEDDEEDLGDFCRGYFTLNVSEYLSKRKAGEFFISVSLGRFQSNIVHVIFHHQ